MSGAVPAPVPSGDEPPRVAAPTRRPGRLPVVLLALVGGAIALIASTQTWVGVELSEGAQPDLAVAGADAVPVLAPLSLAALALGLALTLVGRIVRYVFGALAVAIGAGIGFAAFRVIAGPPRDAYAAAVTEVSGLSGADAVDDLVSATSQTAWPIVALAAAVIVVVAGIVTLVRSHTWTQGGRRFRTAGEASRASSGPVDAIDAWDDLSRGDDPTRP